MIPPAGAARARAREPMKLEDPKISQMTEAAVMPEALAERVDEHLKRCLDHAAEGLHWVGPDGTILWANQTELDLLGYTAEEYIGHHIAEFHVDAPVIEDILARLTRGETLLNYEARLRHKDGSIRYVQINSNVLWQGDEFLHTQCFTRDVTDQRSRRRTGASARRDRRKFRGCDHQPGPERTDHLVEHRGGTPVRLRSGGSDRAVHPDDHSGRTQHEEGMSSGASGTASVFPPSTRFAGIRTARWLTSR